MLITVLYTGPKEWHFSTWFDNFFEANFESAVKFFQASMPYDKKLDRLTLICDKLKYKSHMLQIISEGMNRSLPFFLSTWIVINLNMLCFKESLKSD